MGLALSRARCLAASSVLAGSAFLCGCAGILGIDEVSLWTAEGGGDGAPIGVGADVESEGASARAPDGTTHPDGADSASATESSPDAQPLQPNGPDAGDGAAIVRTPDAAGDADATIVDAGADAIGPVCVPSTTRCSAGSMQTCTAMGQWAAPVACMASANQACLGDSCQSCPNPTRACKGACVDVLGSDYANCGACGQSCGGFCAAGSCTVLLATGQRNPEAIAVDRTSIYWTNDGPDGTGSVAKTFLDGGAPAPITLATGLNDPRCLTIDPSRVYWANFGTNAKNFTDGSVMSVGLAGGLTTTLATSQGGPSGIAVDATNVYWTQFDGSGIMTVPLVGGSPSALIPNVYNSLGIAVDATNVYWTSPGTVMVAPLGGGTPVAVASGQTVGTFGIALDSSAVYWTNEENMGGVGNGSVAKVAKTGGAPTVLASPPRSAGRFVVVDAASVYWTNSYDGTVTKAPIGGGAISTIASGQQFPQGIAVDATSVYWANYIGGTIAKVTPK